MLGEIGQVLLILALLAALLQSVLPLVGAQRGIPALTAIARPAAMLQLTMVLAAFVVLTIAFVRQDFSLRYVADNSNTLLPMMYRYSAVWGAHEGSLLLWALVLAVWTAAVAEFSQKLPAPVIARVLGVMGLVSVGFLAFLMVTMLLQGASGFTRTEIALPIDLATAKIVIDPARLRGPGADLALAGAGLEGAVDAAAGAGRVVYFDFDSFVVKDEYRSVVEAHARRMSADRKRRMIIEGHTDERGGREYNLALGQKRADAVVRSMVLLGAQDGQLEAVSFGKERPAAQGSDEAAWAKNRRAELKDR